MKTKFKITGKIVSIVLTICMIVTLFSGIDLFPVSAASVRYLYVHSANTKNVFGYRPSGSAIIDKNTKYKFSFDWEGISAAADFGTSTDSMYNVLRIYSYSGGWKTYNYSAVLRSAWSITRYPLLHGYHYDVEFTTASPSELRELVFWFGDMGGSYSDLEFKTANWVLYKYNGSSWVDTGLAPNLSSVSFRGVGNASYMTDFPANSNNIEREAFCRRNDRSSDSEWVTADGYFDPVPQMIHAKAGHTWDTIAYRGGTLSAGNYQFTVDEAAVGGVKSTVQLFTGDSLITGATKTSDVLVGLKRTVKFTVSATSKFLLWIGERDGNNAMDTYYRYPELYQLDGSGNPTGSNLISHFNTSNVVIQNSHNDRAQCALGKWTTLNQGNGAIAAADIDSASFLISQMIHFPAGYNNYHTIAYRGGALSAGTYRFTVEECTKTGVKSSFEMFLGDSFGTQVWDIRLDKLDGTTRTVEFNFGSNYNRFLLWIGNRGQGTNMDTYYRNPVLKKLDGSGNPTGSNLVTNFNTGNINLTSNINSKTACVEGKWNSVNYASGYIVADNMLTGNTYFDLVYLGGDYNNTGTTDVFDYVEYKKVRAGASFTGLSQDCNQDGVGPDATDFVKLRNTVLGLS